MSGGRLTRKQITSRPDCLRPERWTKSGRNAELKERQKWSHEKPKLDNARNLRGIYFVDPEDKEFKVTIKNARKKMETNRVSNKVKSNLRVFWKLVNLQDCAWEACAEQAAADSQGSRTCVCKHLRPRGGTCRGGRMN